MIFFIYQHQAEAQVVVAIPGEPVAAERGAAEARDNAPIIPIYKYFIFHS